MKISCPTCKTETTWQENDSRPFCSERCKLIDLGQWADEKYRIPAESSEGEENRIKSLPDEEGKNGDRD